MSRKISRSQAIRKAIVEVLGRDNAAGYYRMGNIKNMLEAEFLIALEGLGYTITEIEPPEVVAVEVSGQVHLNESHPYQGQMGKHSQTGEEMPF